MGRKIKLTPSQRPTVKVKGVHAYKHHLRQISPGIRWFELISEPDNPYDANAISVRYEGNVVGYIPNDRTSTYRQVVNRVIASGYTPTVKGKLYAGASGNYFELSLFLLAGDNAIPSGVTLVARSSNYDVPKAYKGAHRSGAPVPSITASDIAKEKARRAKMNADIDAARGISNGSDDDTPAEALSLLLGVSVLLLLVIFVWILLG